MASKEVVVHGKKSPVDLATENKRLRVENAHFRGLVFYDEMFRDRIKELEKEVSRMSEVIKKANSANFNLKYENTKLEREIEKLKNPALPKLTEKEETNAETS
jgi:regulator of replication initiation timing